MARINFKGKAIVANHHMTVPFCELIPNKKASVLAKGANVSLHDNLILHGDNLLALKALMPTHAGRINCVYIDPPYNTGNEGWCYNDKVANPMITEWLGQVVDREDMTRHDKWLSMMYPRLSLLYELLAEDGIIFISIDDNEAHRLRMLLDEIFGEDNFVNHIVWVNKIEGRQIMQSGAAGTHESILVYTKNREKIGKWNRLSTETANLLMPLAYKKQAHEILCDETGEYVIKHELPNINKLFNEETRPNLVFTIYYNPQTQDIQFGGTDDKVRKPGYVRIPPHKIPGSKNRYYAWRWSREKIIADKNDLHFAKHGDSFRVYTKVRDFRSVNFKDIITNINGSGQALRTLGMDFPHAKPVALIKLLIQAAMPKNAVILDSFAGSGTTAQAVLELNKEDGGKRKFVLVECEKYANTVTAERVRRVIKETSNAKQTMLKNDANVGFSYWELGAPIKVESMLGRKTLPSYEDLARYVFYTATGEEWNPKKMKKSCHYIGNSRLHEVYLLYKPSGDFLANSALTRDMAKKLPHPAAGKTRIFFAAVRHVDEDILRILNIKYCQLPFEIYKMKEVK